jgi:hypothetical protein
MPFDNSTLTLGHFSGILQVKATHMPPLPRFHQKRGGNQSTAFIAKDWTTSVVQI